jgi:hypothetical protein
MGAGLVLDGAVVVLNVLCAYLTPGLLQLQLVQVGGTRGIGGREWSEWVGWVADTWMAAMCTVASGC